MGYAKIENLYRPRAQNVLDFKFIYALEKIHGTSGRIHWDGVGGLTFHPGGEKLPNLMNWFDGREYGPTPEMLADKFLSNDVLHGTTIPMTIYGEVYGGRCQKMGEVYGDTLRFIAFDVKVGEKTWFAVPKAEAMCTFLGLEFVHWDLVSTEGMGHIDKVRDAPSVQARKNGMGEQHREGIVLRPPFEVTLNSGSRVCAKHKGEAFSERVHTPKVNPGDVVVMHEAQAVAETWVTQMRLAHVLDKIPGPHTIQDTGLVIKAMVQDVLTEGEGELEDTKAVRKAIGGRAAKLYKMQVTAVKPQRGE